MLLQLVINNSVHIISIMLGLVLLGWTYTTLFTCKKYAKNITDSFVLVAMVRRGYYPKLGKHSYIADL